MFANPQPLRRAGRSRIGFTLVEVMIGALLLALVASSLVAAFIQNARMARALSFRTVATTTAMGIAEQLRSYTYEEVRVAQLATGTAAFLPIEVLDPRDASAVATTGMRPINLLINSADGTEKNSTWNEFSLPVVFADASTARAELRIPLRFWLATTNRRPTLTQAGLIVTRCEVFEIALIYQWQNPNASLTRWQSGVIRIVTSNLDMNVPDQLVTAP